MSLIRWKPNQSKQLNPWADLEREFFGRSLFPVADRMFNMLEGSDFPAVDVHETKDAFQIRADLPGMKKEDISLNLHNDVLTIAGERKSEQEVTEGQTYRLERSFGRFERNLSLGVPVDEKNIKASYKDGVLDITLPKDERARTKVIDIDVK